MNLDFIPIWFFFVATLFVVLLSIEIGYRLGHFFLKRAPDEKESSASAITGSVLGLTAFMLVFTFGIVANRFDARKELVRTEANAIGTAYLRTDFLPEGDSREAKELFVKYVDLRLEVANARVREQKEFDKFSSETAAIQGRLWQMAVANGRKDMDSEVGALYIDSLNQVFDVHALRVAIGIQARIPAGIWVVLYFLIFLGMMAMGYHSGISGSRRSIARLILAFSFALVIALIAALDRPRTIVVSQQPLIDLRSSMGTGVSNPVNSESAGSHESAK